MEHTNLQKDCITKLNSDESPPSGVFNSGEVSKKVCVIYDPRMLEHIQPVGCNSKENPEKLERIRHIYEQLEKDYLLQWCKTYECEEVKRKHLFAVHEKKYIGLIEKTSSLEEPHAANLDAEYFAEGDIYFSKGTATAVLLAAGGAVKACDLVANVVHENVFAIIRPPGHHAKKKYAEGFCFVNNAAVAAMFLLEEHRFQKVLILDWDIHHGNRTQELFYDNNNILFFSLHRHSLEFYLYDKGGTRCIGTGKGKGFNVNFCWKHDSIQDDDFITVWDYLLLPMAREFDPDIVLISAGFDAS